MYCPFRSYATAITGCQRLPSQRSKWATYRFAHLISRALLAESELLLASRTWSVAIEAGHAVVPGDDIGELGSIGAEADIDVVIHDALISDSGILPTLETSDEHLWLGDVRRPFVTY